MHRRSFLKGVAGILAAGVAPGFVQAGSLMRINPDIIMPRNHFDLGQQDHAIMALVDAQGNLLSDPVKVPASKNGRIDLSGLNLDVTNTGVIDAMRVRMPGFKSMEIHLNAATTQAIAGMKVQMLGDVYFK